MVTKKEKQLSGNRRQACERHSGLEQLPRVPPAGGNRSSAQETCSAAMADPNNTSGNSTQDVVLEEELDPSYEPSDAEIQEYAQWLGMDVNHDTELMWIAREGLKVRAPMAGRPSQSVPLPLQSPRDAGKAGAQRLQMRAALWNHTDLTKTIGWQRAGSHGVLKSDDRERLFAGAVARLVEALPDPNERGVLLVSNCTVEALS